MNISSDRLSGLVRAESLLLPKSSKDGRSIKIVKSGDIGSPEVERVKVEVMLVRDEHGSYGLSVSGENPFHIQEVKEGGPAARVGVQKKDRILKINNHDVTGKTHSEVVDYIKAKKDVQLLLERKVPYAHYNRPLPALPHGAGTRISITERDITGPSPVNVEQQRKMDCQKANMIQLMLEKELKSLDTLRAEFHKSGTHKVHAEVVSTEKRIRTLQEQLRSATGGLPDFSQVKLCDAAPPPPPLPRRLINQASAPLLPPPVPPHRDSLDVERTLSVPVSSAVPVRSHSTKAHSPASQTSPQCHQRTKSSPDPIGLRNSIRSSLTRPESVVDERRSSCGDLSKDDTGSSPTKSKTWEAICEYDSPPMETPPGTPPPAYTQYGGLCFGEEDVEVVPTQDDLPLLSPEQYFVTSNSSWPPEVPFSGPHVPSQHSNQVFDSSPEPKNYGSSQASIMGMEDEDCSDQEGGSAENHGPFNSLSELMKHNAYMAVFIKYLLSNCDPSSLFFYIVTNLYKEGNAKDMKKWVYEIHSTFLIPEAPLRLVHIDERALHEILNEIDLNLQDSSEKEEILRKVFWKARSKAKKDVEERLATFRTKRIAGLGGMFGPPDEELRETVHDKAKEARVIEKILDSTLRIYREETQDKDDCSAATVSALVTIMNKHFGLRFPILNTLLERYPTFVTRDRSLKPRFAKNKKVQGHHLTLNQYFAMTPCSSCAKNLWGVGPQGYICTNCKLNFHKSCIKDLNEACVGAVHKQRNPRLSKLIPDVKKKTSQSDRMFRRPAEEGDNHLSPSTPEPFLGERGSGRKKGEEGDDLTLTDDVPYLSRTATTEDGGGKKGTSIGRSESYKERVQKRPMPREKRKHSDPNLPRSKTSDGDLDSQGVSYPNSSSSNSTSSLSNRSLDSPSNSLETVRDRGNVDLLGSPTSSSYIIPPSPEEDSDLEADTDLPDWTKALDQASLKNLKPKEKKRQELINELFHTERTHVRVLKVLERIFHRPLRQSQILSNDQLQLLFSNLPEMLELHQKLNDHMKLRKTEKPLVDKVADILVDAWDGVAGEVFQQAAANYCKFQSIALETLTQLQRNQRLQNFLQEAEANTLCRRLQLKDMLPAGMQRLTKYPLLIESLAGYTAPDSEEHAQLMRALDRSKQIAGHANQCAKEAQDHHRLADIQKRLDKSHFDKTDHPVKSEFKEKGFDLTNYKMVHEGDVLWKISNRQKTVDLHILLLEDFIVLLQKQDDKFVLKFNNMAFITGKEDKKKTFSPIIKYSTVLVRTNAIEKRSFFLVNTAQTLIYDMETSSLSERESWVKHITEATENYKIREGQKRRERDLNPTPTPTDKEDETEEEDVDVEEPSAAAAAPEVNPEQPSPAQEEASLSTDQSPSEPSKAGRSSPQPRKLPQRFEILQIVERSQLIPPSEVVVSVGKVLTAEPVLTPLEKLRRQEERVRQALEDKQKLVAEILRVPPSDYDTVVDVAAEIGYDPKELVLVAMDQCKRLQSLVNDNLKVSEEETVAAASSGSEKHMPGVPTEPILQISGVLNNCLTHLLRVITDRDTLIRELRHSRALIQGQGDATLTPNVSGTSPTSSRPASFISVGSSVPDHDSEAEKEVGESDRKSPNCEYSTKCADSTKCEDSTKSGDSTKCEDSADCENSAKCEDSTQCENSAKCEDSAKCENSTESVDSAKSENSTENSTDKVAGELGIPCEADPLSGHT